MPPPLEYALHDPDITASKAEKAKQLDEERKLRFFDCKQRQIGVDIKGLNAQVEEKRLRKAAEKEQNRKTEINKCLLREENQMKLQEQWERRFSMQQLQNYWKTHQRRELSRDFDLYDPDYLKKSLPMCTGDNDPRIKTKGSLLRFEGEDYDGLKQKKKSSKLKQLLDEQIREKEERRNCAKLADEDWVREATIQSEFNKKCTELEERVKKEEIRQVQAYNLILAKEKKAEKLMERKRSTSDDLSHVYNCLTSSFFLESGKEGLTPDQLKEIKEIQKQQIIEQEQMRSSEKERDNYFIRESATRCREEQQIANNNEVRRRDEAIRIRNINRLLAIEQLQRRKQCDSEARHCTTTDEFYAQFNKTAK